MKLISSRYDLAEFRRGKDKRQRKKKSLLGAIGKGALIGAVIPVGVGALGMAGLGASSTAKSIPQRIFNTGVSSSIGGAMGGALAPATALAGGATAATAYGINKLRNKDKKPTVRSRLNNLIPGR
jgi:hypothetical protein